MKCPACNYEYDWDFNKDEQIGDQPFVYIQGNFVVQKEFEEKKLVHIFACPKCGCVLLKNY